MILSGQSKTAPPPDELTDEEKSELIGETTDGETVIGGDEADNDDKGDKIDFATYDAYKIIQPDAYDIIYEYKNEMQRAVVLSSFKIRAKELGCLKEFENGWKVYMREMAKINGGVGNYTKFTGQKFCLVCGAWTADDNGVYTSKASPDGATSKSEASPIPIMPTAIFVNSESGVEKLELSYRKNGCWRSLVCERAVAASSSGIVGLANSGVEVNTENSKALVRYIAECVALNPTVIPVCASVSHLGWKGDSFVPYTPEISFDGETENRYLYESVRECGNIVAWRLHTVMLRENNPLLRLTMAAAFASPLIEIIDALPFVLHLWGGTGTGKTVALMVAASIWGNPSQGKLTRTMNMTANAMMDMAAFLRNLPFIGDELQTIKANWNNNYDDLIMCITEGTERARMSYNKANAVRAWRNSFVFSGEEPVTKNNSGGGAKNRVIEIYCDSKIIENGNETVGVIRQNYGFAGRMFINGVNSLGRDKVKNMYAEYFAAILKATNTTEKQAMAGALLLTADKIASNYVYGSDNNVSTEIELSVNDVARYMLPPETVDASERAYEYIQNHIAINSARFGDIDNYGEIWGKIENDITTINKNILTRELAAAGWDFEAVKGKWADNGYLIRNSQNKFMHQTKCNGVKANYIKLKISDIKITIQQDMDKPPFEE